MILKIDNLIAETEDKKILDGINLSLERGEVHAIMGPNGSGKSTLSKVIAGHPEYIAKGSMSMEVDLKKRDLTSYSPDERAQLGVFLSFQHPVELPGVSNFTFLKAIFNSHLKKKGAPEMDALEFREHITPLLEELEIDDKFLERFVNQDFSGGEKKRNEALQMLLLKPKLVLLDEIDSGLGIDSLALVSKVVNSLRGETSFLIVTHYNRILDYVKPDFVHILIDGKIVKSGDHKLAEEVEKRGYNWL